MCIRDRVWTAVDQPLTGPVIHIDMRYGGNLGVNTLRQDHVTVVLAGNEYPALFQIPHRMVPTPVSIGQTPCFCADVYKRQEEPGSKGKTIAVSFYHLLQYEKDFICLIYCEEKYIFW